MKNNFFSVLTKILFRFIFCVLIAIIISVIIEWIGMAFLWTDNQDHAKNMFNYEYSFISYYFDNFIFGEFLFNSLNDSISFISNCFSKLIYFAKQSNNSILIEALNRIINYIHAALFITLVVIMRAFIFILSLPWFVVCGCVGFADGLVERSIRKFEGGVEHGMIHHLARSNFSFIVTTAFIVYLGIPFAIHPSIIVIPFGILFGIIVFITVWSFKKYI